MKGHRRALAFALAVLAAGACAHRGPSPASPPTAGLLIGVVRLRVEVADSPADHRRGLMGRTAVPPGTGMLFRFRTPVQARFFMYDTPVALTAVFVRNGRVVHREQMPPCGARDPDDCPTYGSPVPYDAVVEAAPGSVAGVSDGDRVRLT